MSIGLPMRTTQNQLSLAVIGRAFSRILHLGERVGEVVRALVVSRAASRNERKNWATCGESLCRGSLSLASAIVCLRFGHCTPAIFEESAVLYVPDEWPLRCVSDNSRDNGSVGNWISSSESWIKGSKCALNQVLGRTRGRTTERKP
jgi:hypothetical protein